MSGVLIALVLALLPAASVCDSVGAAAAAAGGGTPVAPRTLYFRNECKETVRLGATGGNTDLPCSGDGSDASCPAGTQCGLGQCYFALTEPEGGWDLAPGATRTVELPKPIYTQTKQHITWSGALFASTGCDSTPGCATALCPGVNGTCAPYRGPLGPRSLIEFTLQPNANDYFDISIINGVNVPVSMEPLLPSGHVWGPGVNVDPAYWCAAPGAATQPSGSQLAGCSWRFNASEVAQHGDAFASRIVPLVARSPTPTPCSSDADCGGDMRCGLQMDTDPKGNPMASLSSTCGKPLGWWTADEVCAWTAAKPFGAPFDCAKATAQGPSYMDLYGCSGGVYGHSCYSQGATDTCCGCPDWPKLGIKAPAAQPCQNHNPVWAADALPAVAFLKRACPTAYSFPFDDLSSTFQCAAIPHAGSTNNTASYRISFCPGGATLF